MRCITWLTHYLLVSSADNFANSLEPDQAQQNPTKCCAWSGSKLFDTLIAFLKEFFKNVYFEKISRQQQKKKNMQNYPVGKKLIRYISFYNHQGSHRLEKYLNLEGFLEKFWKLNLPWKVLETRTKALKSPWFYYFV